LVNEDFDYIGALANRVISDPELHAANGMLVSYFNSYLNWLNAKSVEKLTATVTEVKEQSEEAMATARARGRAAARRERGAREVAVLIRSMPVRGEEWSVHRTAEETNLGTLREV
jgi:hypothetical protein